MHQAPQNKTVVVAVGFTYGEQVETSTSDVNIEELEARHEEANTRMVLHCTKSQASAIVVASRDTDVLVLLLVHFAIINCDKVWMMAGTSKKQYFIPMHAVAVSLEMLCSAPCCHVWWFGTVFTLVGHMEHTVGYNASLKYKAVDIQ